MSMAAASGTVAIDFPIGAKPSRSTGSPPAFPGVAFHRIELAPKAVIEILPLIFLAVRAQAPRKFDGLVAIGDTLVLSGENGDRCGSHRQQGSEED